MGDRTHVQLTLRVKDYDRIKQEPWFDAENEEWNREEIEGVGEVIELSYEEVNYGELSFLAEMEERGIPYDQRWEAGGGFNAGIRYVRYSPEGEKEAIEYDDERANPPLYMLERLSSGLPETHPLVCYLAEWRKNTVPRDFENQDEYSRAYLARKLLAPQTLKETS